MIDFVNMKALDQFVSTMSTESIGFPDDKPSDGENEKNKVCGFGMSGLVILLSIIFVSTFLLNHYSSEDNPSTEKNNNSLSVNNGLLGNILSINKINKYDRWCTENNKCFLVPANTSLNMENISIQGSSILLTHSGDTGHTTNSTTEVVINRSSIIGLYLVNRNLSRIETDIFFGLINLITLYLDNSTVKFIQLEYLQALTKLKYLSMKNNKLTLDGQVFPVISSLSELYLDNNSITTITGSTFANLYNLQILSLSHNNIDTIAEETFQHLELTELNICQNNIVRLNPALFINQKRLKRLCLGNNPLGVIPNSLFEDLVDLEYLNLENVQITTINSLMFESLKNLQSVHFESHYYCQYVPNRPICEPLTDGISSATNLLSKPMFRYWNWIMAAVICLGNFLVIFSRIICKDDNQMLSLVIRNLAVSDFLMGVYLLIIGTRDAEYRDIYDEVVQEWTSSWGCTITGIVGMVSSEVTVCFLVFISVDRFLMITSPLGRRTLQNKRNTFTILGIIWSLGIMIAVVPVLRYANDHRFYGVNGLCFPLHISESHFPGWQYSAVIVAINAGSLVIIAVVYVAMFISIWKTRNATSLPRKEYEFVVRFFFIVFISAICWLPIIVLKAMVVFTDITDEVYSWLVVFVLPINSASNPILYTFTSPKFAAKIKKSFTVENVATRNSEDTSPVPSDVRNDYTYEKDESNSNHVIFKEALGR